MVFHMNFWIEIPQAVSSRILNSFIPKEKTQFWLAGLHLRTGCNIYLPILLLYTVRPFFLYWYIYMHIFNIGRAIIYNIIYPENLLQTSLSQSLIYLEKTDWLPCTVAVIYIRYILACLGTVRAQITIAIVVI